MLIRRALSAYEKCRLGGSDTEPVSASGRRTLLLGGLGAADGVLLLHCRTHRGAYCEPQEGALRRYWSDRAVCCIKEV